MTRDPRYYDTNPLMRWAESQLPSADQRCVVIGAVLDADLGDGGLTRAISEITIAELHTSLTTLTRDGAQPQFDMAWADMVMRRVYSWLESGTLQVVPPEPKLIEKALALVDMGTRQLGVPIRAWDAAHIVQAAAWARSLETRVELVTGDAAMHRFLIECPGYSPVLIPVDPEM